MLNWHVRLPSGMSTCAREYFLLFPALSRVLERIWDTKYFCLIRAARPRWRRSEGTPSYPSCHASLFIHEPQVPQKLQNVFCWGYLPEPTCLTWSLMLITLLQCGGCQHRIHHCYWQTKGQVELHKSILDTNICKYSFLCYYYKNNWNCSFNYFIWKSWGKGNYFLPTFWEVFIAEAATSRPYPYPLCHWKVTADNSRACQRLPESLYLTDLSDHWRGAGGKCWEVNAPANATIQSWKLLDKYPSLHSPQGDSSEIRSTQYHRGSWLLPTAVPPYWSIVYLVITASLHLHPQLLTTVFPGITSSISSLYSNPILRFALGGRSPNLRQSLFYYSNYFFTYGKTMVNQTKRYMCRLWALSCTTLDGFPFPSN